MLTINQNKSYSWLKTATTTTVLGGIIAVCYVASNLIAPSIPGITPLISGDVLAKTVPNENRLIIPKQSVEVNYSYDKTTAFENGAWWRNSDRSDPSDGGSFVLTAPRLNVQTNPIETVKKSPFYNLEKLEKGEKVVIDYEGSRYGYEVTGRASLQKLNDIIAKNDHQLVLYSSDDKNTPVGDLVLARPLGQVNLSE